MASSSWSPQRARQPFVVGSSAWRGLLAKSVPVAGLEGLAQRLRDRVSGAVADLEQALGGGAAAAGEPVAAVLPRELDAELFEPVDRALRIAGQRLDEPHVGALVRALPDVGRVLLGRVVFAERRLDPALRLGRVAGLDRALGREGGARAAAFGRDRGGEPGGTAPDHEHVEAGRCGHGPRIPANVIRLISRLIRTCGDSTQICCKAATNGPVPIGMLEETGLPQTALRKPRPGKHRSDKPR